LLSRGRFIWSIWTCPNSPITNTISSFAYIVYHSVHINSFSQSRSNNIKWLLLYLHTSIYIYKSWSPQTMFQVLRCQRQHCQIKQNNRVTKKISNLRFGQLVHQLLTCYTPVDLILSSSRVPCQTRVRWRWNRTYHNCVIGTNCREKNLVKPPYDFRRFGNWKKLFKKKYVHSQNCVQRPPLGLKKSGRYSKVKAKWSLFTVYSYKIAISFVNLGLKLAVEDRWPLSRGGR
jgi:hypothetical protein